MTALSDWAKNKVLDHVLGTAAWAMPAQLYLALYTVAPTDAGGGTEVAGNGYARKTIDFDPAAGGTTDNAAEILFDDATAAWGDIVHWGLFDAAVAGNFIMHDPWDETRTILTGDVYRLKAGELDVNAA